MLIVSITCDRCGKGGGMKSVPPPKSVPRLRAFLQSRRGWKCKVWVPLDNGITSGRYEDLCAVCSRGVQPAQNPQELCLHCEHPRSKHAFTDPFRESTAACTAKNCSCTMFLVAAPPQEAIALSTVVCGYCMAGNARWRDELGYFHDFGGGRLTCESQT